MSLKDFIRECHNRGLYKMLSIYIVSSWVVLQVLAVIAVPLGIPEISVTVLILILLIGFPVYNYYLWITRVRFKTDDDDDSDELSADNQQKFRKFYFTSLSVVSILTVVSVVLIIENKFGSGNLNIPTFAGSNKIAVLNFSNNTGDEELNSISKMAADWLIYGITENEAGEVISSDIINNYSNALGVEMSLDESTKIMNKFLNPSEIISGAFFKTDSLIFRCSIKDGFGKNIYSFSPVKCDVENPMNCIEELRQKVVGYLVIDGDKSSLEETPPKYRAYEKLLEAKAKYNDRDEYYKLLKEALIIDPDYFEPKGLIIQHFYNLREYKVSDSLIKDLAADIKVNKRQQHFLNFLEGLIEGDHAKTFNFHSFDYNISPFDLSTNSTQMTLALQFINRPELVEEIFKIIDMSEMILEDCDFCKQRYFSMGNAYNELQAYQKTIDLLKPVVFSLHDTFVYRTLASAYIKSKQDDELIDYLDELELKVGKENLEDITIRKKEMASMYLYVGKRYLLVGDKSTAAAYFEKVLAIAEASDIDKANAFYYKGDFKNAEKAFIQDRLMYPGDLDVMAKLAVCHFNNGAKNKAKTLIESLENLRAPYQYGSVDYAYAVYYASTGEKNKALEYLESSVAEGKRFIPGTYNNDTHFLEIKDTPEFKKVITHWHE